jgi:hypothetical protein
MREPTCNRRMFFKSGRSGTKKKKTPRDIHVETLSLIPSHSPPDSEDEENETEIIEAEREVVAIQNEAKCAKGNA